MKVALSLTTTGPGVVDLWCSLPWIVIGEKRERLFLPRRPMTAQKQLTFWLSSLAVFLLLCASGWATEIPAADYRCRIKDYVARLEQREGKLQPDERDWFKENFPPDLVVKDAGGEGYLIDRKDFLRWIQEAEDSTEGRDRLIAYQKNLLDQISWEGEGSFEETGKWEECRGLLDQIYGGKEFRGLVKQRTPPWQKYIKDFFTAVDRWLEEHLKFLGGIGGEWIFFATYLTLLVLATILIIWIMRLLGPVGWRWRQPGVTFPGSIPSPSEKHWREWRDEAEKKAQQGAFREAIRFLFISVLVEGQQKGWWLYEPEATNREHLARVETTSDRREPLERLIKSYELAWYGLRQPGRQEFQECEHWVERMEALA